MLKKIFKILLVLSLFYSMLLNPKLILAQEASELTFPIQNSIMPTTDFYQAQIVEIVTQGEEEIAGKKNAFQLLKIKILSGNQKDQIIELKHGGSFIKLKDNQKVSQNEKIVLVKTTGPTGTNYYIADKYRLDSIYFILLIFFILIIIFGKKKGLTSIIGLIFSILFLTKFIVPNIIAGFNPLIVTTFGCFVIATISLYLSHGFSKKTSIALTSTLITLTLASLLAVFFVNLGKLFGLGSDEAALLQFGPLENLNLKGLLLAGMIIGTLGVLDDITTAQTAAIDEISKANPKLTFPQLYKSGITIGKEHIASLVNTLALAYAGASLPLFLLFNINQNQPLWATLNSEFIAEELIRTLVGSSALILAVPITTLLAAYFLNKSKN